jgi:hypothetical protein
MDLNGRMLSRRTPVNIQPAAIRSLVLKLVPPAKA